MSSRDWVFRIQDILRAVNKIESFAEGMTFTQFKKNELVIDAVVYCGRPETLIWTHAKAPAIQRS